MNTSEVLNTAADLIEERGWSAGTGWLSSDSALCLEGGIAAAMGVEGGPGYRCPAYHAVASYLGLRHGLFLWNDHLLWEQRADGSVDFTRLRYAGGNLDAARAYAKERVIEVLRACAVIEEAREEQDAAWETYAEVVTA